MLGRLRLRTLSTGWVVVALLVGIVFSALWFQSDKAWREHLNRAFEVGVETFFALENGDSPKGVTFTFVEGRDIQHADLGRFERMNDIPRPAYVTQLSFLENIEDPTDTTGIKIAVLSDRLQYKVAEISAGTHNSPALKFGDLTRLLATYCSDPLIFANQHGDAWVRIDGTEIWGCDSAPRDYRLGAALIVVLTLAVLVTQIGNTTESFAVFSKKLRERNLMGGPDSYDTSGPQELNEIVQSVNAYLEAERSQLSKRAVVLSGVSHDLGTPAARLRLRAELIDDPEIRGKFETDIDQMTGIIESVLTFTQSELNSETPRNLSLTSLVEALVADYQDTGQQVSLIATDPFETKTDRSVFAPRAGVISMSEASKILMYARPIALRRAISNLIDNALKYGRRATVSIEADSHWAIVTVEDEGSESSASEMERLMEPFERGDNTQNVSGFGLGLTIVATVARQHGGKVEFEDGNGGVRARLWLGRS